MTAQRPTGPIEHLAKRLVAVLFSATACLGGSALAADVSRVQIQQPDGSLQCQPNSGTPLEQMHAQLTDAGIEVYSARNMSSGMMVPAVCDTPTGRINVFEIDADALDAARDLGFLPPAQPPRP